MGEHFADRLLDAISRKGSPVCVGLDPHYDCLPEALRKPAPTPAEALDAIRTFCAEALRIVAPIVPAVKPQIAYFEVFGGEGVGLYFEMVRLARELGLMVIGDVKRGDIGSTAAAYAQAHLEGESAPDAVTVNAYFGADGLAPFVASAAGRGRGAFALVRTSNPSAATIQDFADGSGRKFYEHIAGQVAEIGRGQGLLGDSGYSCLGAVVGATWPGEARRLREIMPQQLFLVPGYGAQGATAEDCAASFKPDGSGAIVNASRSVLYAHQREEFAALDWRSAVGAAAEAFAEDVGRAVGR